MESAKSRAWGPWRAYVLVCLACLRVCVLACLYARALLTCFLWCGLGVFVLNVLLRRILPYHIYTKGQLLTCDREKVFLSALNLRCFELWMDQGILFEITRGFTKTNLIKIRPKKLKDFTFSVLNTFFRNCMCFVTYSSTVIALGLSVYSCHTIVMPQFVIIALICNTCPNL